MRFEDKRTDKEGERNLVEGIGKGTRLDSRDGDLDFEYREGERQRETWGVGGGGWGDKVSMTREVSDKCQGVVWRIWDKCGGWAWREGVDSRDGDLEGRTDQAPISD